MADNDSDDFGRVYAAVAAGETAEQLRRVLNDCAAGSPERRAAAANHAGRRRQEEDGAEPESETPIAAAHRLQRGDLVGALIEAGADASGLFGPGRATALAACIAHGQAESVAALLKAGADADKTIEYGQWVGFNRACSCTAVHFCVSPRYHGPPQIACLDVLLRDGGADANATDSSGAAPLVWLAGSRFEDKDTVEATARLLVSAGARASGVFGEFGSSPLMLAAQRGNTRLARFLIDKAGAPVDERNPERGWTVLHSVGWKSTAVEMATLLLDAGADVNVRNAKGETPLLYFVGRGTTEAAQLLLDRGASADMISDEGSTPLICQAWRCRHDWHADKDETPAHWRLLEELLRRSSAKTRRAVRASMGWSAADVLVHEKNEQRRLDINPDDEFHGDKIMMERVIGDARRRGVFAELLASGAPLQPEHAAVVLPLAAARGGELESALSARLVELGSWRAHESFVGVALDFAELRAEQAAVEAKRARVEALKQELRELGAGSATDDSDDEGSSDESDGDESSSEESEESDESDESESDESEGAESESDESEGDNAAPAAVAVA